MPRFPFIFFFFLLSFILLQPLSSNLRIFLFFLSRISILFLLLFLCLLLYFLESTKVSYPRPSLNQDFPVFVLCLTSATCVTLRTDDAIRGATKKGMIFSTLYHTRTKKTEGLGIFLFFFNCRGYCLHRFLPCLCHFTFL